MNKILFREHRGSLSDSMETVQEISTIEDIRKIVELPPEFTDSDIVVKSYVYDHRIGWETYIVHVNGYGVLGFTNGAVE